MNRFLHALISTAMIALASCSAGNPEKEYARLLDLSGINTATSIEKRHFLKTSGIDPYYLAELRLTTIESTSIFTSPSEWEKTELIAITPPEKLAWWRPHDLKNVTIWTKNERKDPSYTQVITGTLNGESVLYVAWVKTFNY